MFIYINACNKTTFIRNKRFWFCLFLCFCLIQNNVEVLPHCGKPKTLSRSLFLNFVYPPNVYIGNSVKIIFKGFKTFFLFFVFLYALVYIKPGNNSQKITFSTLSCSKLLCYTFWINKLELRKRMQ